MNLPDPLRRRLVHFAAIAPFPMVTACATAVSRDRPTEAATAWAALERASKGRLGVAVVDSTRSVSLLHRGDERFPMCSTFKLMAAAAVLKRSEAEAPGWLQRRVPYETQDLVPYSPVTQLHVGAGMPVDELCAATLQWSDNTAANLLMQQLGGPSAVTAFARSIGDTAFRLDRWEPELNTALPGDPRDTTTPAAMAASLRRLVVGDALPPASTARLVDWLRGCRTGAARVQAGVPAGWAVGDKTGTGNHGTTNDVAVVWPPGRDPIIVVVFFTQPAQDAKPREDVVAAATRIAVRALH